MGWEGQDGMNRSPPGSGGTGTGAGHGFPFPCNDAGFHRGGTIGGLEPLINGRQSNEMSFPRRAVRRAVAPLVGSVRGESTLPEAGSLGSSVSTAAMTKWIT